jgi:RNA polymerase sigma-70 factor (ECF subfamily)
LRTLTPQTQLILQECYVNRKKYKEVAEELEISTNTVKKHIVKALKTIREGIAKKSKREDPFL